MVESSPSPLHPRLLRCCLAGQSHELKECDYALHMRLGDQILMRPLLRFDSELPKHVIADDRTRSPVYQTSGQMLPLGHWLIRSGKHKDREYVNG